MADCNSNSGFPNAGGARNLARDWSLVYTEICIIQQEILEATSQCSETGGRYCTVVSGNTPMTFVDEVYELTLVDGGSGYQNTVAEVVFDDPDLTGSGAVGRALIDAYGGVEQVIIVESGIDYSENTTVDIEHPNGVDFIGDVVVNGSGQITKVNVINNGVGYYTLTPTTLIIDPEITGSGAETKTTVDDTGSIVEVELLKGGSGYSQSTFAEVAPADGSPTPTDPAEVDVSVRENIWGTDSSRYYYVLTQQVDDPVIQDQIEYVITYFTSKGYTIDAQVNPDTMSTIQWNICW